MHTAAWDTEYNLKDKKVMVIGAGSSAAQVVPNIQPHVRELHSFIKSPTWITAGFAQRFAGPDGGNFQCESYDTCHPMDRMLTNRKTDSDAQKAQLRDNPKLYLEYRKMVEGEIGRRFRFLMKDGPDATEARKVSRDEVRT